MGALHQMGHDSNNLLDEEGLSNFAGAILSPVNYPKDKIAAQVKELHGKGKYTVFDPQIYFPKTERGRLREWGYFPKDVDTADLGSLAWWSGIVGKVVQDCAELGVAAVCSPAVLPKAYTDDYFETLVVAGRELSDALKASAITPIQSLVVGLSDLALPNRAMEVASIITAGPCEHLYLVLVGATEPRRELTEVEQLKGAMSLIRAIASSGIRVLVGFCSSDALLWKHAGAADVASGKFFNLRRFTKSRWEEPKGGGGQLPYWFEEGMLAFLRESDLRRLLPTGVVSDSSRRNPYAHEIVRSINAAPPVAWLGKSWRQYLWWFADMEQRISDGADTATAILASADENWSNVQNTFLADERQNDGAWIRHWRRACMEYEQPTVSGTW